VKPAEFRKYLVRDERCWHCGFADDTLVPQHRVNRGMGGSKQRHRPSNIIVLCSQINGLIEADPKAAQLARDFGWKLPSWVDPTQARVFDAYSGQWFLLDDDFNRQLIK
jgi:hypothetical protein